MFYDGEKIEYFDVVEEDTFIVTESLWKQYSYYDLNEKLVFRREYDSTGFPTKESGISIGIVRTSKLKLELTDTFLLQCYMVRPDLSESEFSIDIYDEKLNLIYSEEQPLNKKHNAVFFSRSFDETGEYTIIGINKLINYQFEQTKIDSARIKILIASD